MRNLSAVTGDKTTTIVEEFKFHPHNWRCDTPLSFSLMPKLAGSMVITNGCVLRFKNEIHIVSDLCSYFDKLQESQASPLDTDSAVMHNEALLVISHNDFQTTDCAVSASSLT
jgi:hypothetical protein